uniref:Uncharacterized protein n=1 Tax=Oryza glumipatula TaxID=40148 RepID=A0A0D9ZZZ7_9ORYZ
MQLKNGVDGDDVAETVAKASSRPAAAPSLPCHTRSATTAALGGQIEDDGVGGQIRRRRSRCGEREATARRPATARTAAAVAAGDDVGARGYARENNRQGDGRRMCVGPIATKLRTLVRQGSTHLINQLARNGRSHHGSNPDVIKNSVPRDRFKRKRTYNLGPSAQGASILGRIATYAVLIIAAVQTLHLSNEQDASCYTPSIHPRHRTPADKIVGK